MEKSSNGRTGLTSPLRFVCGNPYRGSQTRRILQLLAPVAGNGIQQDKLRVDLVLLQVQTPDRCIIGHDDQNVAAAAYPVRQVILQMAGMLSLALIL